jgi:hypothetical protein
VHKKILKWVVFLTLLILPVASIATASTDASCDLAVATSYGNNDVTATVTWSTGQPQGWHVLNWGDNTEVGFQGLNGVETRSHTYVQSKKYTLVFTTDAVDGDESSCTVDFEVDLSYTSKSFLPLVSNGLPSEGFFCRITSEQGKTPNDQTATVEWSGTKEDWWLLYWGDESQTGAESPGFYGSAGTKSYQHVYDPGTYVQESTIENEGGEKYTCRNTVVVP